MTVCSRAWDEFPLHISSFGTVFDDVFSHVSKALVVSVISVGVNLQNKIS